MIDGVTTEQLGAFLVIAGLLGGQLVALIAFLVRIQLSTKQNSDTLGTHAEILRLHSTSISHHDATLAIHSNVIFGRRRDDQSAVPSAQDQRGTHQ